MSRNIIVYCSISIWVVDFVNCFDVGLEYISKGGRVDEKNCCIVWYGVILVGKEVVDGLIGFKKYYFLFRRVLYSNGWFLYNWCVYW